MFFMPLENFHQPEDDPWENVENAFVIVYRWAAWTS